MDKSAILKGFNNHIDEFFEDLLTIFPDDYHINKTKETLLLVKKSNPKLLITLWYSYIALRYGEKINNLDSEFFINKDYSEDIQELDSGLNAKVVIGINSLRDPIKNMNNSDKLKAMEYLKNLTQLSVVYQQ
tara:strand:- start:4409 stop:4804 length:396 start_codon:yes stop_codon:yes gene_type:complete